MISLHTKPFTTMSRPTGSQHLRSNRDFLRMVMMWLCIILACASAGWFAFQCFLVPQPHDFAPDWQNAQWVQAADSSSPVAYFRFTTSFPEIPDSAFVTVAADQTFKLYVNGFYIDTDSGDFVQGDHPRTYTYDISTMILHGANVIGLRVANIDRNVPQVRANIGVLWGKQVRYFGTSPTWQVTGETDLAHPRADKLSNDWARPTFDASSWKPALVSSAVPAQSRASVSPAVYEQPMPAQWLSAGHANEGYYVSQFSLASGFDQTLLRLVATGDADVFVNGYLYAKWTAQVAVPHQNLATYLNDSGLPVPYHKGLLLGIYDITPYLHPGSNTVAVHVFSPGDSASRAGLDIQKGALSADVLVVTGTQSSVLLDKNADWRADYRPTSGWTTGSAIAASWHAPLAVSRPGRSSIFYLPGSTTPFNQPVFSIVLLGEILLLCSAGVVLCWWLGARFVFRRYYSSFRESLEATSLVFLPALACEVFLITLSGETLIAHPFPYTTFWAILLLLVVALSMVTLWANVRFAWRLKLLVHDIYKRYNHLFLAEETTRYLPSLESTGEQPTVRLAAIKRKTAERDKLRVNAPLKQRMQVLLRKHWVLLALMVITLPMISYNLSYEPYWQDELASYQAALGVLARGAPFFPSGIYYPKAELFSYMLAAVMTIFGHGYAIPRTISWAEYVLSLPLLYAIGYALFKKRSIAWLATAMLAFSPSALLWGRQERMYEQALVMVLLTMFLFYRAILHRDRARPIYIAVGALLIAYLSHEESFIILPALLVCVLLESRAGKYGIPDVLRRKHWWFATFMGVAAIGIQLIIVMLTHSFHVGSDQSTRPQIQPSLSNIPFYYHLLFIPLVVKEAAAPWSSPAVLMIVNSLLAIFGGIWAWRARDRAARYCALFLLLSWFTLMFIFTMQADRYFFPLLPAYYLLGAYGCYKLLRTFWIFARPHLLLPRITGVFGKAPSLSLTMPTGLLVKITAILFCASVLLVPMLPLSNYNLFVSRALGLSYHRHYADYDDSGAYIKSHWHRGDIVVTIAPAVSVQYYVGQADYFLSVNRALFVFERDGQLYETTSGSHPLFNQADLQTVLASHARVWIISDNGSYQAGAIKNGRFTIPPPDFLLVYEGYGSAVYFRSNLH